MMMMVMMIMIRRIVPIRIVLLVLVPTIKKNTAGLLPSLSSSSIVVYGWTNPFYNYYNHPIRRKQQQQQQQFFVRPHRFVPVGPTQTIITKKIRNRQSLSSLSLYNNNNNNKRNNSKNSKNNVFDPTYVDDVADDNKNKNSSSIINETTTTSWIDDGVSMTMSRNRIQTNSPIIDQDSRNTIPSNSSNSSSSNSNKMILPWIILLSVPIAWGTFEVAIRYIYNNNYNAIIQHYGASITPIPIPPLVVSVFYYIVASIVLVVLQRIITPFFVTTTTTSTEQQHGQEQQQQQQQDTSSRTSTKSCTNVTTTNTLLTIGGLELGGYLYIGNMFQMIGLQTITADQAAFLLQLTTILVPLFQQVQQYRSFQKCLPVLTNRNIQVNQQRQQQQNKEGILVPLSPTISTTPDDSGGITFSLWIACIVAFFGVYLISIDTPSTTGTISTSTISTTTTTTTTISWLDDILTTIPDTYNRLLDSGSNPFDNTGTIWIIGAAIVYTFHCIRLEYYSQALPRTVTSVYQLASAKVLSETFYSVVTILGVVLYYYYYVTARNTNSMPDTDTIITLTPITDLLYDSGQEVIRFVQYIQEQHNEVIVSSSSLITTTTTISLLSPISSFLIEITNWIDTIVSSIGVPALLAIVWIGCIPVGYTIVACTYGQRYIPATIANLIYTLQPFGTALVAFLVLHEQSLSPLGYCGGSIIVTAVVATILLRKE